jgi:glycosyltransferase involved in cell wall biosynthesis
LHVAQINFHSAPPDCTPTEVFARWPSLADIPEAAASAGTRVSVIQAASCDERLTLHGVDYHFTDIGRLAGAAERGRHFARMLVDLEADVLHVHGLGFGEDAFAISQCLPGLPLVFQDHADRPPRWWWRRSQWRRCHATAAGVVFTAPELAAPFTRARLFAPLTQLFAIPESSSRFVTGNRAEARAVTGLYGDPCVLMVGHLAAGKDPLTVLDGVAQAAARLPGMRLWCAFGNAPLLDEVQQRIDRDPRLSGRVHLLGRVEHARIQTLMQAADLFVSGSLSESCGYALLEALASGVTPVVTDIPSFRALTGDGRIGQLWPPGDAAGLAEALVRASATSLSTAQVRAHFDATLSFAAVGRRWADAYAQVLDGRIRSAA